MSIGKLTDIAVTGATELSVAWDDGRRATIGFAAIIAGRAAIAPLADVAEFGRAAMSRDQWSVEWPCGVDFGAPQLRRWADEQAGEIMPASAFRAWLDGHGLTLDTAATSLGLSRRTIAYYLSGEQPVPKTVMLATLGYDRREAA